MPDLWMDVDIALSEVPVNILPLLDDTDFKTRETAVAYNAAGMDLVWNFVTTGGTFTQTAVTPTTGGNYDWAHQGDGMYTIEIPASGGASINNDTEGFGWFTGVVTGVLPWRGPVIGFRAAALNNDFVDGSVSIVSRLGTPAGASIADDIAAIEAQTDDIGAAGVGLTAVPWNPAWDTEVQSEVDDALVDRNLDKLVIASGTADSGTTTTMVDAARTEGDADYWKGRMILFTSGNISGQCAIITDFNAGTDTFIFAPPLTQAVATQNYVILPGISVWDDTLAEHLISGSTGAALNAAGAAGDPWNTSLPGAYGAGTAGYIVGNNLDASVADVEADTQNIQSRLPAALVSGRMDANIQAAANGVITAAVMATDAIDADTLAADAIAEIKAAVAEALVDINLDHLLAVAAVVGDVVDSSIIARLASKSATPAFSSFVNTTDSLEAIADNAAPSAATVAAAVRDVSLSGAPAGSLGAAISNMATTIWSKVMDPNAPSIAQTAQHYMNIIVAAVAGVRANVGDWSAKSLGGDKTRLSGTLDATGQRSDVDTLDGT